MTHTPTLKTRLHRFAQHCRSYWLEQDEPPRIIARLLAPTAVLAHAGDDACADHLHQHLRQMADDDWGLHHFHLGSGLNDAFTLRALTECYAGLIQAHRLQADPVIDRWLYQLALIRSDGSIAQLPDFEGWHQRNQNVPATFVYNVAHYLDHAPLSHTFDTALLYQWADAQMAGWDLTWRGADNSWLYQFIWNWGCYRHALIRRPDLLTSENAYRALAFYKDLAQPGGIELIFGESQPGDILGPLTSILLGAKLFRDGEFIWLADEVLTRAEAVGTASYGFQERCVQLYRLYTICPEDIDPTPIQNHDSIYITSPLAGRGWSLGGTVYDQTVKTTDPRFPAYGINTNDYDPLYQVQDPTLYVDRPDKLLFRHQRTIDGLRAAVQLRCQSLHEHADALGVIAIFHQAIPWIVETGYIPRDFNRYRWLHNVPLYRAGHHTPADLRTHHTDSWREPDPDDVVFHPHDDHLTWAMARVRHDSFDYVQFDGHLYDSERLYIYDRDAQFLVVDRLTPQHTGPATIGQIWHTSATATYAADHLHMHRDNKHFQSRTTASLPLALEQTQHDPGTHDPLYFPGPVTDLLHHAQIQATAGQPILIATTFGHQAYPLTIDPDQTIHWHHHHIRLGTFAQLDITGQQT